VWGGGGLSGGWGGRTREDAERERDTHLHSLHTSVLCWLQPGDANEGPVKIQYKCLVFPFLYSQKIKLCSLLYFQNRIIMFCLSIPTLILYICERFIYFQGSVCRFCCSKICVDRSWEYINR
jgi:hypothetical protein